MSSREPHAATQSQPGRAMGMRGCEAHAECSSERPGHGLHRMQARLSEVAASKWVDALVVAADADGFVTLADLEGDVHRVWHHEPLSGALPAGSPVALHPVYGVLVVGSRRISVAGA
ncbi:hypothetical protein ACDF64_10585 [Agromyces sp. MMS24-JH15]|uniref:hypothetical protein n=1 Tax=Agromyces sp. MMS24-JH15 TaxID=3243765 RepID=UPI00374A5831